MAMANHKDMISTDEARIMLLEQKNDDFHQALIRIEKRFDQIDRKFDQIEKNLIISIHDLKHLNGKWIADLMRWSRALKSLIRELIQTLSGF